MPALELVIIGAVAAISAVLLIRERLQNSTPISPAINADVLSDYDKEIAIQTEDVVKETIGEKPVEALKQMSSSEKIAAMENLSKELIKLYDLNDVQVEIVHIPTNSFGYYCHDTKTLTVDISYLLYDMNTINADNRDTIFEYAVRETIDTIVHELRHAVQHKAIQLDNNEYWEIDESKRIEWAQNIINYISPDVDPKGYYQQPIECDAFTFAHESLKGVFSYE